MIHPVHPVHPAFDQTGKSGSLHPARATYDAKMLAEMDAFLIAFPHSRSIAEAATCAGVTFGAVYQWRMDDALGFLARFKIAQGERADYLEELAQKRVESPSFNGRIGSDVLLIAMLNANEPGKWRQNVTVQHDLAGRVLEALRQAQGRDRSAGLGYGAPGLPQGAGPPGRVVEGEAVERAEEEKG